MEKAVIFDFDGVIADTFDVWLEYNRLKNPNMTVEQMKDAFNGNYWKAEGKSEISEEDYKKLIAYEQKLLDCEAFDGMAETLSKLSKDASIFIVTSSLAEIIQKFLNKCDIDCVTKILGANEGVCKTEKTLHIIDNYKLAKENAVFVTDTLGDIKEAEEAGLKTIAVGWGWHEAERLQKGNPQGIAKNPNDLYVLVTEYLGN